MKTLKVFNVLMMTILFASTNWSCRHARVIESTKIDTITTMKKWMLTLMQKSKSTVRWWKILAICPTSTPLTLAKWRQKAALFS